MIHDDEWAERVFLDKLDDSAVLERAGTKGFYNIVTYLFGKNI